MLEILYTDANQERCMKNHSFLLNPSSFFYSFSTFALAQTFNGKGVIWEMTDNADARVEIKFGTAGVNIGGYEGTTIINNNLTSNKIYVDVKLVITGFCGDAKTEL